MLRKSFTPQTVPDLRVLLFFKIYKRPLGWRQDNTGSRKERKKKTKQAQRNKDINETSFIIFLIALFFKHLSHRSPGDTIAV